MGKHTGSWKEKQGRRQSPPTAIAELDPFAPDADPVRFGYWYSADGRAIETHLCLACAAMQGIDDQTPGWHPCEDVPEVARYESCADCGLKFTTLLPMRCPACGNRQCFVTLALAWVHVGPSWAPHGTPDLADDWDEAPDAPVCCTQCDFQGDAEAFWPPWPAWWAEEQARERAAAAWDGGERR